MVRWDTNIRGRESEFPPTEDNVRRSRPGNQRYERLQKREDRDREINGMNAIRHSPPTEERRSRPGNQRYERLMAFPAYRRGVSPSVPSVIQTNIRGRESEFPPTEEGYGTPNQGCFSFPQVTIRLSDAGDTEKKSNVVQTDT